jgi:hypothetical protein
VARCSKIQSHSDVRGCVYAGARAIRGIHRKVSAYECKTYAGNERNHEQSWTDLKPRWAIEPVSVHEVWAFLSIDQDDCVTASLSLLVVKDSSVVDWFQGHGATLVSREWSKSAWRQAAHGKSVAWTRNRVGVQVEQKSHKNH